MASSPTVKIEHSVGIRQKAEQGLVDDARLLRKIDARLMPWLVLLFFLSSLDKYVYTVVERYWRRLTIPKNQYSERSHLRSGSGSKA